MSRLSALLAAMLLLSCQEETIILIDEPTPRPPREGPPCQVNEDCGPGDFCERMACSEPAGLCHERPLSCELGPPVCGCNGVVYPSDCIRRAAGITSASPGPCGP